MASGPWLLARSGHNAAVAECASLAQDGEPPAPGRQTTLLHRHAIAAALLALTGLAACGGGDGNRGAKPAEAGITIEYMDLEQGTLGLSLGGHIGINRSLAGSEDTTLDALSTLLVHELWHELVSNDHLEPGCYAAAELSVHWGAELCPEEQRRWLEEASPGNYVLRVVDPGLLLPTQRAAGLITNIATLGAVTFTVLPLP